MLTRARRRDAEPSAAVPEPRSRPAPQASLQDLSPQRPAETGVRFTRTPDHVLQARHRRREQVLREKEEALRAAEAEAAALAQAELAAAEAARVEAEAARAEAEAAAAAAAVPLWRQPYVLPPGVRFTRTPDHLLRHSQEEIVRSEAVPEPAMPEPAEAVAGDGAPETGSLVESAASSAEPVAMVGPAETTAMTAEAVAEAVVLDIAQETVPPIVQETVLTSPSLRIPRPKRRRSRSPARRNRPPNPGSPLPTPSHPRPHRPNRCRSRRT